MKTLISNSLLQALLLAGTAMVTHGCGSKDDDSTASTATTETETETTGGITTVINALAAAYPGALALSVFPETTASLRLTAEEEAEKTYTEKVAEADKRLRGEGDCFVAGQLGEHKALNNGITCYEFDSDMNPSTFSDRPNQGWGTKDGTDGKGQACMVSFAKDQVEDITHTVDRALAMVQGLICVAKKDAEKNGTEVAKPTPDGDAIDLAAVINASLPADAPIEFSTASMSAVTNDDDSITYITEIAIVNPFGKTDSITLRHTPAEEEGGTESGVLTFDREPLGAKTPNYNPNDPNADDKKHDVMAISYQKTSADHMKAELTRASINEKYEPIDDNGLVNFAAVPDTAQNSDISAIKYVAFDLDPETGAGDLSYWMNPGGNLVESARGFLFNISADDEGLLKGCGISGATRDTSIRKVALDSSLSLNPVRYWHPRWGQNTSPDKDARYGTSEGNSITEQCFKQDATTGKYVIDTAKTVSTRGYEVIAGTDSAVKPPERPAEPLLPPLPPKK
jgi:hypothetical protein